MSQRQTHQPVMISAEPGRRGKAATLLTVVALLTASVAVIFLGACDPVFLLPIGDKLASVGLGGTWATIMAWRPVACGVAASVLMATAAALWVLRSVYEPFCDAAGAWFILRLAEEETSLSGGLGRSARAVLVALVVARIPTIPWANFVRDDFEILTANRTNSLAANLVLQHGDHAYPLYRLQVWVCDLLFGTWAPGWNLILIATYAAAMWLAAKSARVLGAAPVPTAVALAVFGMSWTMGLLHAGYYVLSTTIQIAATAFAAFLCYTLADRRRQIWWIPLGMAALLAGCLIDISGVWILGAVPLLLLSSGNDCWTLKGLAQWVRRHIVWVWTWLATACLAGAVHCGIYLSSQSDFLAMSDYFATPLTLAGAMRQIFYLIASGTLLQLLCPLAAYLPWPVHAVSLAAAIFLVICAMRIGTPRQRASILAVVTIMAAFAIEVAIGRPQDKRVFFPQYVATLNILTVPLLAILITVFSRVARVQPGKVLCGVAGVTAVLLTVAVSVTSWIPAYAAYVAGLNANQTLRRDIAILSGELTEWVNEYPVGNLPAFPAIDGRHFKSAMPRWPTRAGLAPYNLSHYRHFMDPKLRSLRLVRNVHMSSWVAHDVETVESVRTDCGPFLMEALAELPNLRAVLAASIDLSPFVLQHPLAEVSEHHVQTVTSDGSATVPIRTAPFDPEAFPYLLLDLALPAGQTGARLLVRSALLDGTVTDVGLHLTATSPMPIKINVLEAPWLAIQPVLSNVSLVLAHPGEYVIRRLSLLKEIPTTEHFRATEPRIPP